MPISATRSARLAVLVLGALLLSHELIYLLAHGSGAGYALAMTERGHDQYWTGLVLVVGGISGLLTAIVIRQFARLYRDARELPGAGCVAVGDRRDLVRRAAVVGGRIAILTIVTFFIQENVEVASIGQPVPLLGAFTGEHGVALPVIVIVGLLFGLVDALVAWRRQLLIARLRTVRPHLRRQDGRRRSPPTTARPRSALAVRARGLRAPPTVTPLPTTPSS